MTTDFEASFAAPASTLDDCRILVAPAPGGWCVQSEFTATPLMFLSGAKAEEKARALAGRVAATGRDVQVVVHDRRCVLVGTFRFFAQEPDIPPSSDAPPGLA